MFLLKDTTQWCRWASNPWPIGLMSSTLPMSHCAPQTSMLTTSFFKIYIWESTHCTGTFISENRLVGKLLLILYIYMQFIWWWYNIKYFMRCNFEIRKCRCMKKLEIFRNKQTSYQYAAYSLYWDQYLFIIAIKALTKQIIHVCLANSRMIVCLMCCFTSQVNSYGHGETLSSPNHTFSWATLNKQKTSTLCTYFPL